MIKGKIGVIDIGSNSVRLMLSINSVTIEKHVKVTKLAKGLGQDGSLCPESMERTADAVCFFVNKAKIEDVEKIYIFATAAVRSSKNGEEFTQKIFELTGIRVDVVSGEKEAKLGIFGALSGRDGGVIDVGGASTEIVVIKNSEIIYSESLYLGVVNVTDKCGQDYKKVNNYVKEQIKGYNEIPNAEFYAIGGTATSLAAICIGEEIYDPNKVHGYKLTKEKIEYLEKFLTSQSVKERENVKGLQRQRAEVICSGLYIIKLIMEEYNINCITVSEKDNLEGYLGYKEGKWQI